MSNSDIKMDKRGEGFNTQISIVLPVHNGAKYLRESIESCMNQTFPHWELILVNDCSTDDSGTIAEEYAAKDQRIRVIHNETNLKLPASLNAGFRQAKGEYLTWTSDDNRYLPHALQRMIDFLRDNPQYKMVCAACEQIDEEGKSMNSVHVPLQCHLLCGNSVGACFLYHRNVLETVGEYDSSCFLAEDYDYWLRVGQQFQIGSIDEVHYCYRMHSNSLTSTRQADVLRIDSELKRKYWQHYHQLLSAEERKQILVRLAAVNAIDSYRQMKRYFPEGLALLKDRRAIQRHFFKQRYLLPISDAIKLPEQLLRRWVIKPIKKRLKAA